MANNNYQWPSKCSVIKQEVSRIHSVNEIITLSTKIDALTRKISSLEMHGLGVNQGRKAYNRDLFEHVVA